MAYRLEPLFSPKLRTLAPQQVPLAGAEPKELETEGPRIDWALQEDSTMASELLQAGIRAVLSHFISFLYLFHSFPLTFR